MKTKNHNTTGGAAVAVSAKQTKTPTLTHRKRPSFKWARVNGVRTKVSPEEYDKLMANCAKPVIKTDEIGMAILAGMWKQRQITLSSYSIQMLGSRARDFGISAEEFIPRFKRFKRQRVIIRNKLNPGLRLNPEMFERVGSAVKKWQAHRRAEQKEAIEKLYSEVPWLRPKD